MKAIRRYPLALAVLAAAVGLETRAGASPFNVSVITEMTDAGRAAARTRASGPAYYIAHDGGLTEEGIPIAGERPPSFGALAGALKQALAVNGYLPADPAHPASLLIFYRWGSYNHEAPGFPELARVSLVERAALVGGTKFGLDVLDAMNARMLDLFRNEDSRNELLMEQATSDLYFVVASAYDLAAAQRGEGVLLWRTKTSVIARGEEMDDSVPRVVAAAAPYFGRNMTEAAWIETRSPAARVEAGPPVAMEFISAPLPAHFVPDQGDLEGISKQKIGLPPF